MKRLNTTKLCKKELNKNIGLFFRIYALFTSGAWLCFVVLAGNFEIFA